MNRFDVCEAYALFAMLWGSRNDIDARLRRIGFRISPLASLEKSSEETKTVYAGLVRRHEGTWTGMSRILRRLDLRWPGSYNLPGLGMWDKCVKYLMGELSLSRARAENLLEAFVPCQ
jgi:hypothetical protein